MIYVYGCFACMYVCVSLVRLVLAEVREGTSPLELELQIIVRHHVGARN